VVDIAWYGSNCIELTYKDAAGHLGSELLYRDREPALEIVTAGRPWSFDGDGKLLRPGSEAYRIRLAYLFDPLLAVHTSLVDPLPHQITAVYEEMLTRQPLRFLLADDPGAGKTVMAGLFIKELLIRGNLRRAQSASSIPRSPTRCTWRTAPSWRCAHMPSPPGCRVRGSSRRLMTTVLSCTSERAYVICRRPCVV
jgi:hypothetical protein